ncbi:MG2 domain-containing protein [Mucilaginibacter sp. SMC90]|uniref:alpha-2-macroglobulin family protein n=1 Tax=Mucilaginibacter sp. SMC90 TaxID=2929803 RepID=UPI001FB412DC|nr:alpha-2-macroglobulin family protein [Mucilaginibacter sp. SMC90]UOE46842.1 MG2 domain-containing protein [Mucilaginibacter sp. SMC90]
MLLSFSKLLKYLPLAVFLFCFTSLSAQTNYSTLVSQIDSLTNIGLPKSALILTERLDSAARKNAYLPGQIQAAFSRVSLQSTLDADDQATNIEAFQIRIRKADYPVKPILQSLLAQLYWVYYQQNRYRISQRIKQQHPDKDIRNWDTQTIFNQCSNLYELSLADAVKEQSTPVNILGDALKGDTSTRYLRPTLYDLLLHRALDFFLSNEATITQPRLLFTLNDPLYFSDSKSFTNLRIATTDTSSVYYKGMTYLQQATLFHLQKQNTDALADIDLKRIEFVNTHSSRVDNDTLYVNALRNFVTGFSSSPISADALVLLGKYYSEMENLATALQYYRQAVAAHPESTGGKNAANYIRQITQTTVTAFIEDVNIPGRPLLASLNYRNIKTVKIKLYKIWATQYNQMAAMHDERHPAFNYTLQPIPEVFDYLKKLRPLKTETLQLPAADDYRPHITEFKIDALNKGVYVLVIEDPATGSDETRQLTTFKVSALTSVSKRLPDGRTQFSVLNRETGVPLPGVQVTTNEANVQISDANGNCYFDLGGMNQYAIKLTTATDTLYSPRMFRGNSNIPDTNANRHIIFFTDREIYRPGQAIYFKGLFIRIAGAKNSSLRGEKVNYVIKDNNNKALAGAQVSTNDFGSFAGSFVIPQNISNGWIMITTPFGNKRLRVEEYKRPGFIVKFLPVKNSYKPNDSVTIKGTVKAYSGYGLSQARVAFRISMFTQVTDYRKFDYRRYRSALITGNVVTDTVQTDSLGEFEIKFKASVNAPDDKNLSYHYSLNADVTAGSGETQSANTSLIVTSKNIEVFANVPERIATGDSSEITASVQNLNAIKQSGQIKINIYAIKNPGRIFKNRLWNKPDTYLMSREDYRNNFPQYAYADEDNRETWPVQYEVGSFSQHTDGKSPVIFDLSQLKNQPTGSYKVVINAQNEQGDTASHTYFINLFNKPARPQGASFWVAPAGKQYTSNNTANFMVGLGATSHVLMEKYSNGKLVLSKWLHLKGKDQQLVSIPVDTGDNDQEIQFLSLFENKMYTAREMIGRPALSKQLTIKFLTFRDKLQPGEKEEWKLQVSGTDKQQAEMVAGLYDASLDPINGAQPGTINYVLLNYLINHRSFMTYANTWTNIPQYQSSTQPFKHVNFYFSPIERNYERLLMSTVYADANQIFASVETTDAWGIPIADPGQLNYKGDPNMVISEPVGNSKIMIGSSTTRLDGKGHTGTPYQNPPQTVMRQVVNDYGDQASLVPIIIRKNFAETAFFYPQLHTDETGNILLDFTLPEELTTWHFKAFAHTKDLKTGYIERQIVTQKKLSIIARAPRFLREGDTIVISATLANLTASPLKGVVELKLFNALNMQPVSWFANISDSKQAFDLSAGTNKAATFKLIIPAGTEALTYRLTATSGQFSDGEENTIPVLPNRMLVTESMPMMVRGGQTKSYTFTKLVSKTSSTLKSKTLTLEYTQNPAWYAVQALPYLMEAPYECSEQVFNRYYANSFSTDMVNKLPAIKQVFSSWSSNNSSELLSNLEKNQELKATLLEETPWLRDAQNESEQKKRMALLFDLNKMSYELQTNLNKLRDKQLPDGGFPWFGGTFADRYITQNILAGMGQLYQLHMVNLADMEFKNIADKAMAYLDKQLLSASQHQHDFNTRTLDQLEIHSYYAQSYFTARTIPPASRDLLNNYLDRAAKQWVQKTVFEKGMIALTMLRNNRPKVAAAIIKSLKEIAGYSAETGMYWAQNKPGYYWYQSPIETQSLLIELFTETGGNDKQLDEMKIWLLRHKQTNNWQTTKATAAACYALLMKGGNNLLTDAHTSIKLNGEPLEQLKPAVKADTGTGYIKTTWMDEQVKPAMGKVELKNTGNAISWGALHWQYLENLDKITQSQTNIHLERKYFIERQTAGGVVLTPVSASNNPRTGDKLKVVINMKADLNFEYVQLKDMRPAGTEPADVLSAYKYQDGLVYYQVTKDTGTNFFISTLNKGNYVFQYELRVVQPGSFSTGITSVQCMYAPEFNAHAGGARINFMR